MGNKFFNKFHNVLDLLKCKIREAHNHELFWIVIIGILLRFALVPYFSHPGDPYAWARSLIYFSNGYDPYALHASIYPPFIYLLYSPFFHIGNWLGLSSCFHFVPAVGGCIATPVFLTLWKLPLICFDLLTGFLIYRFVKELAVNPKVPRLAFIIWMFNPLSLVMIYMHGAWDVIVGFFILLGIFLIYKKSYLTAGLSFGLGTLTKLSPIYLVVPFSTIILLQGLKYPYTRQLKKNALYFSKFFVGFILPFLLTVLLFISYIDLMLYASPFTSNEAEALIWNNLNQWFFAAHPVGFQWINSHLGIIQKLPILYLAVSIIISFGLYKYKKILKLNAEKLLLCGVLFGGLSYLFFPTIIQTHYLLWYLPLLVCLLVVRRKFKLPLAVLSVAGIIYYFSLLGPVTPLSSLTVHSTLFTFKQYLAWFGWYTSFPTIITGISIQKDLLFLSGFFAFLGLLILIYLGAKNIWRSEK